MITDQIRSTVYLIDPDSDMNDVSTHHMVELRVSRFTT